MIFKYSASVIFNIVYPPFTIDLKKKKKIDNLLPAIIQNYQTGEVLMLGYLNQEALKITLETKKYTCIINTQT